MAKHDPEKLFALYFEYDGNVHAMLKDERCPIRTYSQLYGLCSKNGFAERLADIQQRAREQTNEELASQLVIKRKEIIAICRAIFVRYAKQLRDEEHPMKVTAKDLNTAYKIFKTEMGEAAEISRHEFSSVLKTGELFDYILKQAKEEKKKDKKNG